MKKSILVSAIVSSLVIGSSALYGADLDVIDGSVNISTPGMQVSPTRIYYPSISMTPYDTEAPAMAWALGIGRDTETGQDAAGFINLITGQAPLFIVGDAVNDMFVISKDSVIINNQDELDETLAGTANLIVGGDMLATWSGSDTANNHNLLGLSVNNGGDGGSDVGFSIENIESDFKWAFRTYNPGEGFAASKIGTGGTEFQVDNLGATTATTKVLMGGVTVFENGALVTSSSRALKEKIEPLDTKAALDAFHKLQPVSYVYKTDKKNPVVGFIAEDVPELVAMPSHKTFNASEIVAVLTSVLAETRAELKAKDERMVAMEAKITKLETMQKRVAQLESILTNLALDTSNASKEKVSMK